MVPSQQLRVVAIYAPSILKDCGASMPARLAKPISSKLVKTTIGTPIQNARVNKFLLNKRIWQCKLAQLVQFTKVANGFLS